MAFNWSTGLTRWSFLGLKASCTATVGITPLAMNSKDIYHLFAAVSGLKGYTKASS